MSTTTRYYQIFTHFLPSTQRTIKADQGMGACSANPRYSCFWSCNHADLTDRTLEMSSRMQEVVSSCSDWQTLHRGYSGIQDCFHIGEAMHRLWYLREEVSLRCHQHYQPTYKPRVSSHAQVLGEQLQAPSATDAPTWASLGTCRNKWYWEEHRTEDTQRQAQAESWEIR